MKIIGLMAARNEQWCLGLSARAALMWLDELVILVHASTDATADIAGAVMREHLGRVCLLFEDDPVWREMQHRQRMLDCARERGATHICYIDADEVLTGHLLDPVHGQTAKRIYRLFSICPPNSILQIPWLALRGSIGQVHVSGPWADNQVASFGFKDSPELHWSCGETRRLRLPQPGTDGPTARAVDATGQRKPSYPTTTRCWADAPAIRPRAKAEGQAVPLSTNGAPAMARP